MKKLLVLAAFIVAASTAAVAQNYMIVNSETVFKSIPAYNSAVEELDDKSKEYQANVDAAYEKIEQQYTSYIAEKDRLSESVQQQREKVILDNEARVQKYQEDVFGTEGTLATEQKNRLDPIRKQVFDTITKYAEDNNFAMVMDVATNPMVIYYSPSIDRTEQIIAILK